MQVTCKGCKGLECCAQMCLTFCDPVNYNLPGSSVHVVSQARKWVGCHFFLQGIFPTQGSNPCLPCLLHYRQILYQGAIGEAPGLEARLNLSGSLRAESSERQGQETPTTAYSTKWRQRVQTHSDGKLCCVHPYTWVPIVSSKWMNIHRQLSLFREHCLSTQHTELMLSVLISSHTFWSATELIK